MNSTLETLEEELQWDALLLQEFTCAAYLTNRLEARGHVIFPLKGGANRKGLAIVVRDRHTQMIVSDVIQHGSSGGVAVRIGDYTYYLVTSHLYSGSDAELYSESIDELGAVVHQCPSKWTFVL